MTRSLWLDSSDHLQEKMQNHLSSQQTINTINSINQSIHKTFVTTPESPGRPNVLRSFEDLEGSFNELKQLKSDLAVMKSWLCGASSAINSTVTSPIVEDPGSNMNSPTESSKSSSTATSPLNKRNPMSNQSSTSSMVGSSSHHKSSSSSSSIITDVPNMHGSPVTQRANNFFRSLSHAGDSKLKSLSSRRGFSVDSIAEDKCDLDAFPGVGDMPHQSVGGVPGVHEEFKQEHKKISTSSTTKIFKDGVIQEKHETTNQQLKKLQAGDLSYHEAQHSQQVKDKVEGDGFSAERMAAKRQDQKVLKCGEVTKERTMNSKAQASRVTTEDGTLQNVLMSKEEDRKQYNKGVLEHQTRNCEKAATKSLANASGITKFSVSSRHTNDGNGSPVLISPIEDPLLGLPSTHQYRDIIEQVSNDFEALHSRQNPSRSEMENTKGRFIANIITLIDKLKEAKTNQDSIYALQAMVAIVKTAWAIPISGHELGFAMCNELRSRGGLDILIANCGKDVEKELQIESAKLIEQALSTENRDYVVQNGLEDVIDVACTCTKNGNTEDSRVGTGILCHMFKHSEETCSYLLKKRGLKSILYECRSNDVETLRHCATALANLSLYGGPENHQAMIKQQVPVWLFPLAFNQDDNIKYWACLAISALCANKEIEGEVSKSGTLDLVEPFCTSRNPEEFAKSTVAHVHGQSKDWLKRFVPVLYSKREEARSLAAFHFVMEAGIKKRQGKTDWFNDIGAIEALKTVASSPNAIASRYAAQALQLIGEELPHKLSQQVPLWSENDVLEWVGQIGFQHVVTEFQGTKVDGDLLLQIDERMLEDDIGITKKLLRMRFLRELQKLKQMADYSSSDPDNITHFLQMIDPELTQYTYGILKSGITDRKAIRELTDDQLRDECKISNSIHRRKIRDYVAVMFPQPSEIGSESDPNKNIDVFISYRRANGSQLASLLKVHLQLRGFTVFLDVERLEAGKFDNNLLNSIKKSKCFLLVLTANALDRCKGDTERKDWVHKEIVQSIESSCNIIPVMDSFQMPDITELPEDIHPVLMYNGVNWSHDYQEACVDKIERFIRGDRSGEKGGLATPGSPPSLSKHPYGRSASIDYEKIGDCAPTVEIPQSPPLPNVAD